MTETTDTTEATEAPEVEATEVTTVTETEVAAPEARAPREPVIIDRPIQTVGRRKEAVVRVRLVPGTGQFNLDGRTLEAYFPNKVHQQLIKAPLVTGPGRQLRHPRPPRWRRPVRAGRRAAPGDRPCTDPGAARGPACAEEGRFRPATRGPSSARSTDSRRPARRLSTPSADLLHLTARYASRMPGGAASGPSHPVSVGSRFGDGTPADVGGCVIGLHL